MAGVGESGFGRKSARIQFLEGIWCESEEWVSGGKRHNDLLVSQPLQR